MKRALIFSASAAVVLTLAACQRTDSQPTADPGTTNEAVNAVQDATSVAVGATSAATVGPMTTASFATNAAIGDAYEIQAGQIAQSKGQSAGVRDFGKMMVSEHTTMSNTLAPLFRTAGVTPPSGLDERRKGLIDNLNAASPADFDQVYLNQQVAAHEEALTLMQGYAERGDDAALKAAAAKAAPKVQSHLERARALQSGRSGAN